jgi:alpha-beta hydrolase superfamily lysophospholipase
MRSAVNSASNCGAPPTLFPWGDQDTFCPRGEQDDLAATISGAQLVIYPGSGHSPQGEEPERFAADLVAFCDRLLGKQADKLIRSSQILYEHWLDRIGQFKTKDT